MADNLTPEGFNFDEIIASISATPDANSGDPVADALTWEQLGPDLNHPAVEVPMPGEVSTPQPDLTGYKGPKVSGSFRGITEEGTKRARGFYGEADQRIAGQVDAAADVANDQMDQSRAHISAVGDALDLAIQKTQEFQSRDAELQNQLIDFNRTAAEVEQRAAAMAMAERQQYIAQYKEQLAVVRQLAMQSGNPMGQLSRGEAIGLAGAQFAQGFLAAQGINIDVAGQVDRWVERSIQEHQLKIQNMRASAEDQLHLYELSRQNSQDEWEARQRYRGFVIAGLQSAIHLNASRFQSDIAMAKAQEQIARLQVEADATERAIADKYFDRVNQIMQTENQRAFQMGNLAIQQKQAALESARFEWEKDPRNPKNKNGDGTIDLPPLSDPEELGPDGKPLVDANGNKILMNRWKVNRKIQDPVLARQVWNDGVDARDKYAKYLDSTNKMMEKYKDAKKVYDSLTSGIKGPAVAAGGWKAVARLDESGKVQEFLQAVDAWAMAKVYNDSGKAATDVEYRRQAAQAYKDQFLAYDGNKGEVSHATLREDGRKGFQRTMESYGFEAVPDTDAAGQPNADKLQRTPGASPRTGAENDAIINGKEPVPGTVEKIEGRVTAKDSEDVQRGYTETSGAWADFKGVDYAGLKKANASAKDYANREFSQTESEVAVELMAAAYVAPHRFYKNAASFGVKVGKDGNEESPAEIRKNAYTALSRLAMGESANGASVSARAMEWAGFLKNKIDEDPELSRALEHDEDVLDSPFARRLAERPGKN